MKTLILVSMLLYSTVTVQGEFILKHGKAQAGISPSFHFLSFVESQPALFLTLFFFLAKSQPGVSYKGCSYKKNV